LPSKFSKCKIFNGKYAILYYTIISYFFSTFWNDTKYLGITLFTVSHRKYLRKHHGYLLTIEGREGKWSWKKIDYEEDEK
jgi:hypothetical protein